MRYLGYPRCLKVSHNTLLAAFNEALVFVVRHTTLYESRPEGWPWLSLVFVVRHTTLYESRPEGWPWLSLVFVVRHTTLYESRPEGWSWLTFRYLEHRRYVFLVCTYTGQRFYRCQTYNNSVIAATNWSQPIILLLTSASLPRFLYLMRQRCFLLMIASFCLLCVSCFLL